MNSQTDVESRIRAAAMFDFKVPDWNETKMDGELLITIRQETVTVKSNKRRPVMDEIFGKDGMFDKIFGSSSTTREFENTDADDESAQRFKGRRFFDVTLRVPTYRVPTIHDLFMRTIKATEPVSGSAPASSYKFNVNCELAPGKIVGLNGCFVKQAPFLHTSVIPNSLIVPLSVDYVDQPDGLLDQFKIEEPVYGTRS